MDAYELLADGFELIENMMAKKIKPSKGVKEIIEFCEKSYPNDGWKAFKKLDYDDYEKIEDWLENIIGSEKIDSKIKSIWIGISNPINENGDETTDLVFAGATKFDREDDFPDWPSKPKFSVEIGSGSNILDEIYQLAYDDENGNLEDTADYLISFAYTALAIKTILNDASFVSKIKFDHKIGVLVGHEEGDVLILGELSKKGLSKI